MRAASATLSTTNMTSSPIILTTRPRALVTMSWEISSKRRTTAASSSSLRCWLRSVKPTMSANPTARTGLCPGARPWLRSIMLRWIPAATWRRHTNSSSFAMAGMVTSATPANASAERTGSTSALDHVPGHELRLGDPGHGRADDAGHLHRRVGIGGAERLQALEEAHRLEVEVGEGPVVVVDAGEAEGAPEALELVDARRR